MDLVGPLHEESYGQIRAAAGFGVACFPIDWDAPQAISPQGATSVIWSPPRENQKADVITVRLAHTSGAPCPQRGHGVSRRVCALPFGIVQLLRRTHGSANEPTCVRQLLRSVRAWRVGFLRAFRPGYLRRTRSLGLPNTRLLYLLFATALHR